MTTAAASSTVISQMVGADGAINHPSTYGVALTLGSQLSVSGLGPVVLALGSRLTVRALSQPLS
ncbi:MAG: hypothetical protein AAF622_00365 [Cyanobacteria bacterium P01_C01_bin.147]